MGSIGVGCAVDGAAVMVHEQRGHEGKAKPHESHVRNSETANGKFRKFLSPHSETTSVSREIE